MNQNEIEQALLEPNREISMSFFFCTAGQKVIVRGVYTPWQEVHKTHFTPKCSRHFTDNCNREPKYFRMHFSSCKPYHGQWSDTPGWEIRKTEPFASEEHFCESCYNSWRKWSSN